jgi:soluble lytic murein transglycosylase
MMTALTAQDWPAAEALAARDPDPIAAELVHFIRLLAPDQGRAAEIGDFAAAHPSWPDQSVLRKNLGAAIAQETDQTQALADCRKYKPTLDTALVRCAQAELAAGDANRAAALAQQAWMTGITGEVQEAAFLEDWQKFITTLAQWRRFDALDWAGNPAADRQSGRLDAAHRALAQARLAFRHNDMRALDYLPVVPEKDRADPALILDQSRYLRNKNALPAALDLWHAAGVTAELAAGERQPAFWTERDRLARALLASGDANGAWFLADDSHADTDQAPDALFLAGWIALQRLHDPVRATAKFQALAAHSPAVITQSRAWYWLARAAADDTVRQQDFTRAAAFPTTFYGQFAIAAVAGAPAIPGRIASFQGPVAADAQMNAFAQHELVRAAAKLVSWGDPERARDFLAHQAQVTPDVADLALLARQALAMGLPESAVLAARIAGRQGTILRQYGWPAPFHPPDGVDPALVLGVMRQESSFDPAIVSHAGAIGLMQMMPDTARQEGGDPASLTDPDFNMRLGVGYLHKLLDQFGGMEPYAVAAYNAGPHRVHAWIAANGDAAGPLVNGVLSDAMIDWIEQIPFNETRNYVQRVLENRAIYASPAP